MLAAALDLGLLIIVVLCSTQLLFSRPGEKSKGTAPIVGERT